MRSDSDQQDKNNETDTAFQKALQTYSAWKQAKSMLATSSTQENMSEEIRLYMQFDFLIQDAVELGHPLATKIISEVDIEAREPIKELDDLILPRTTENKSALFAKKTTENKDPMEDAYLKIKDKYYNIFLAEIRSKYSAITQAEREHRNPISAIDPTWQINTIKAIEKICKSLGLNETAAEYIHHRLANAACVDIKKEKELIGKSKTEHIVGEFKPKGKR
jgi:hypothetical protein